MAEESSEQDPVKALADEFMTRWRAPTGEPPPVEEYIARCPEHGERIRTLFPLMILLEQMGADLDGAPRSDVATRSSCPPQPSGQLLQQFYGELRRMAARLLAREQGPDTLSPTALVHEAYLRVVGADPDRGWDGRAHFISAAATAMQRCLVKRARRRKRLKHGGGRTRIELDEACAAVDPPSDNLLELDEALGRLALLAPAKAELVKLRYFAGLTMSEAAQVLGISETTAARYWQFARVWLYSEMRDAEGSPAS